MRLLFKKLSHNSIRKIMESQYRDVILFVMSLTISIVLGYTLVYNLSDFPTLSGEQIVGIVILLPLLLIFILGTVLFAISSAYFLRATIFPLAGRMNESSPLYQATYVGKTMVEGIEYDLYIKQNRYFLHSKRRKKDFMKSGRTYIRYLKESELGEVYQVETICDYRGYEFLLYSLDKKNKTVTLLTTNVSIGMDSELDFTRVDKMEFKKTVPIEEVTIKKIRTVVDLSKVSHHLSKKEE